MKNKIKRKKGFIIDEAVSICFKNWISRHSVFCFVFIDKKSVFSPRIIVKRKSLKS